MSISLGSDPVSKDISRAFYAETVHVPEKDKYYLVPFVVGGETVYAAMCHPDKLEEMIDVLSDDYYLLPIQRLSPVTFKLIAKEES